MDVSERVKLAREKRGMTQRGLATKALLSNAYVQQLERDGIGPGTIQEPSLSSLKKLATALGVTEQWLAFGSGDEPDWETKPEEPAA